ncbi:hypothetical protein ACPUVO_03995 [Pseudocolwellia sp. HL-MZ19]|uniref:hypothetical protein n=1 Tax=Pseudocolwellia sp. HL-MZ19 TaxID=3400846 RepID=UPI003CE6ED1E
MKEQCDADPKGEFEIDKLLENHHNHIEQLKQYKQYLNSLQTSVDGLEKHINGLSEWKDYIEDNTAELCGHFSENIVWRSGFGTICADCSSEFNEGLAKAMRDD